MLGSLSSSVIDLTSRFYITLAFSGKDYGINQQQQYFHLTKLFLCSFDGFHKAIYIALLSNLLLSVSVSRLVGHDYLRPHRLQPTRLLCPWDFPGKSTGVGCHCLLQGVARGLVKEEFYIMFSYLTRKVNSYDLQEEPTWEMEQPEF